MRAVRSTTLSDTIRLTPVEERARFCAVLGYLRARDGQYDRARDQFADAIRLDPALDLTMIPKFWDLPRGGHEAVVAALELVERRRDAARLSAIIERKYRLRLMPSPAARVGSPAEGPTSPHVID